MSIGPDVRHLRNQGGPHPVTLLRGLQVASWPGDAHRYWLARMHGALSTTGGHDADPIGRFSAED
jgi:hypothetical protein